MSPKRIGIQTQGATATEVINQIKELENKHIPVAWMATGGGAQDSLSVFAAAAAQTERIILGSSIVPTYPRHPLVTVQQAHVINQIAPGRLILGIGESHKDRIEGNYRIPYDTPLTHTREYLHITRTLLHNGSVNFEGRQLRAKTAFGITAPEIPVMISALRKGSYELAGQESDGAISWVCPGNYLKNVAIPALRTGATRSGRIKVPPLVAHAPICVHENIKEVREAVNAQLATYYLNFDFYRKMFVDAGYPEAEAKIWSDEMLDAVVLWGNEEKVADRIEKLFSIAASEIIVTIINAGANPAKSRQRAINLISALSN